MRGAVSLRAIAAGFSNGRLLNKSPGPSGVCGNPEFTRILEAVRP